MESKKRALCIRRAIITTAHKSRCSHVSSCLSCADILSVLYFNVLRLDNWQNRDIFILSKAHAALALYCTLVEKGIMEPAILDGFFQNDGTLPAHLDRSSGAGIEVSAGSLGHGFNIGLGMAYGFKRKKSPRRVFSLIGDGEAQEGSIWEGALFAPQFNLDNFTAILDYNNLQGYGRPREICHFEPVAEKWTSFGWHVIEVDGHDHEEIHHALTADAGGKPKIIIAHTVKGKGVSFMENELIWHYYFVTDEIKEKALDELQ